MVLGKLPVPGRLTLWIPVGRGPSALAVGAGGGCLDIITLIYSFSTLSPSLWETARYRLKYCLKGPLNPEQPTKFLSKFQNHVSQEAQRIESTVAHSWHRVCLSVTFPIRKGGFRIYASAQICVQRTLAVTTLFVTKDFAFKSNLLL